MNKKGFSLMELLIVIAVIGLLSAAAMFALSNVQARARDAKRVADIDLLVKAMDLYINTTGNPYPISISAICLDGSDVLNTELKAIDLTAQGFQDPFYDTLPNCFRYISDPEGTSYSIQYYLETSSVSKKGFNTVSIE